MECLRGDLGIFSYVEVVDHSCTIRHHQLVLTLPEASVDREIIEVAIEALEDHGAIVGASKDDRLLLIEPDIAYSLLMHFKSL